MHKDSGQTSCRSVEVCKKSRKPCTATLRTQKKVTRRLHLLQKRLKITLKCRQFKAKLGK